MKKVKITHLKAPWPRGAMVGDIVQFAGTMPAWANGKCAPAPDGAEADHVYEPPAPPEDAVARVRQEAEVAFDLLRNDHRAEVERLAQERDQAIADLQVKVDQAVADAKSLREQLDVAQAALADAKRALAEVKPQAADAKQVQGGKGGK